MIRNLNNSFILLQEHIRKVLPPISIKRNDVLQVQNGLQGHFYDMEYGVQALKSIEKSESTFHNIQEMIKASIFIKQQLKYEEKKKIKTENGKNSVYKRFSAHLTFDPLELPDLNGVVRETSGRMDLVVPCGGQLNLGELQRSHTTLH
ncbi:BLOC-1-related complex subunit 8 homolog [Drosophila willistoni]|uniref:BLOC-1-related complex subunit 8 homolog n=1 Tax=Drosophila willistoni TaxID=7260 RepID=UPI001F07D450|nr:BLOC-1-related complex subunit 8 homolog [Drosophila willistoni]